VKIAFVNQAIDSILPPYQSSVGACTYGMARSMSKSSEVVVYGSRHRHNGYPAEFRHQNIDFRFLSLTLSDRLAARAQEKYSKLRPASAPASSSEWVFRAFGCQVAQDLRSRACDVIHVQHCSQYLQDLRACNPNARIVLQLHAEWFSQNRPEILEQRMRHADLVTTVSNHITEKTCRQFPMMASRCQTIYNGIDAGEFSRRRNDDRSLQRERRILYAGAVSPHKGLHVLLDAFSIVAQEFPQVQLDVVGAQASYPLAETFDLKDEELIESVYPFYAFDYVSRLKAKLLLASPDAGTYLAQLKERLSPEVRRKVAFIGFIPRPELIDFYYNADVFAFAPIWDEGFGIPPVEAMAAGVPVVATRSGAIPEIVRDQQTGFLVGKNDPRSLAESILKLLRDDDLRERMGQAARDWVQANFTWDKVAGTMYECYSDLCSESEPAEQVRAQSKTPAQPSAQSHDPKSRTW
jgi:glycosyltransferase involved in cell wall biosynthesis